MDYRKENLELKMALALMVQQFYSWRITPEEAEQYNIKYDKDDKYVECYFHTFESAGERAWRMLGLDNPIIGESEMWELTDNLRNKLLAIRYGTKSN